MNKKILIPMLAVFVIGLIVATGYVVNHFVIKSDVYEPFNSVQYAILGDGGNWNGVDTCVNYAGEWQSFENGFVLDVQGLYAGEGRKVCVKINNLGEGNVPYTIQSTIINEDVGVKNLCLEAFGEPSVSGEVLGLSEKIDGVPVVVSGGASPVNDCEILIEAIRG